MRRFFFTILVIFLFPPLVQASDQFNASLQMNYAYDVSGQPTVTQFITLTNRVSNLYASSYQFTIHGEAPKNITGNDSLGPLRITTSKVDPDGTQINVNFNNQVVGKNQMLQFSLQYLGQPAIHRGQVWEITVPQLGSPQTFDHYLVSITVPDSFGQPAFISPPPDTSVKNTYTFTANNLQSAPITAVFGNLQSFGFRLDYYLPNTSSRKKLTAIALPPDTSYQHLLYTSLNPAPDNVTSDPDGNWLAQYFLPPHKTLLVTAVGQAHIQSYPGSAPLNPSPQDLTANLQPTAQWPVDDPQFQELARQYATPEAIYDYVVNRLSYSPNRVSSGQPERRGAKAALNSPDDSICTDFTDVFITLARAAGIPAREINGYAYTTTPALQPRDLSLNTLHAWPEYWDKTRAAWISIDPTWAKTTGGSDYFHQFDFNHFAFVIHGHSSTLPLSAGEYTPNPTTPTVSVSLTPFFNSPLLPVTLTWHKPFQFLPLLPTTSKLELDNPQGQAVYHLPVSVAAQNLSLVDPPSEELAVLPPFSKTLIPVNFSNVFLPDFSAKYFAVTAGSLQKTYNVSPNLFLVWYVGFALISTAVIISLAVIAVRAWGLYLQGHPGHHHLHR